MANADPVKKSGGEDFSGCIWAVGAFLLVGVGKCFWGQSPGPAVPPPQKGEVIASRMPAPLPLAAAPLARLDVRWRDATGELQQLAAGMAPGDALAAGLSVVLTGTDTYAARVQIANTGNVPVRVYPENILVHFGQDAVGVTSVNHPRFLQRSVLEPGEYAEGLVLFRARVDVGAWIRLGDGALSYNDDTVQVTYGG